jgi:hypothetical protein
LVIVGMSLVPFNGADPSNILAALYRDLSPEQVISLQLRCDARSADRSDNWLVVQQILGQPAVYEAFGISSLPQESHFHATHGLEVIGTLANLLHRGGVYGKFVDDMDSALHEARLFLDVFYQRRYCNAVAYSGGAWCSWFIGDGMVTTLDVTLLFGNGTEWWLLAVTDTD